MGNHRGVGKPAPLAPESLRLLREGEKDVAFQIRRVESGQRSTVEPAKGDQDDRAFLVSGDPQLPSHQGARKPGPVGEERNVDDHREGAEISVHGQPEHAIRLSIGLGIAPDDRSQPGLSVGIAGEDPVPAEVGDAHCGNPRGCGRADGERGDVGDHDPGGHLPEKLRLLAEARFPAVRESLVGLDRRLEVQVEGVQLGHSRIDAGGRAADTRIPLFEDPAGRPAAHVDPQRFGREPMQRRDQRGAAGRVAESVSGDVEDEIRGVDRFIHPVLLEDPRS